LESLVHCNTTINSEMSARFQAHTCRDIWSKSSVVTVKEMAEMKTSGEATE
jgi:hypothetical protein